MFKGFLKTRSHELELLDTLNISETNLPLLIKNLNEFELLNKSFGTNNTLLDGLDKIISQYKYNPDNKLITIADIGCGGGDLRNRRPAYALLACAYRCGNAHRGAQARYSGRW